MNPLLAALVAAGLMTPAEAEVINRQLDGDAARQYAEQQMLRAWQVGLSGQQSRLIDAVRASDGLLSATQQNKLWAGENDLLWNSIRSTILDVASEHSTVTAISAGSVENWSLINEAVIREAEGYYLSTASENVGSVRSLNNTSRQRFTDAFVQWQRGELPVNGMNGLPELIRSIEPIFGVVRAEAIGVTETTRLFSMSELAAGNANPFTVGWVYNTANDSLVSALCRPANGTVMLKGQATFPDGLGPPPRHVRCRSFITAISQGAMDALREQGVIHA